MGSFAGRVAVVTGGAGGIGRAIAERLAAEGMKIVERRDQRDGPSTSTAAATSLGGAICEPEPVQRPRSPIMIGDRGERSALRIVAEHADIWASPTFTAADFRSKSAVLDEHCAAIGRDPGEIIRSAQVFFFTPEEPAAGSAARFPRPAGARELMDAGARHLALAPVGAPPPRRVADEIIRPVLATTPH